MKKRNLVRVLLVSIAVLIGARMALPYAMAWWLNDAIAKSDDFSGHIEDIDLALWRGTMSLREGRLVGTSNDTPLAYATFDVVDAGIDWGAVLAGELVGSVSLDGADIVLSKKDIAERVAKQGPARVELADKLRKLAPLRLNSLTVKNTDLTYKDTQGTPPVLLSLNGITVELTNLTNIHESKASSFAHLDIKAKLQSVAPVALYASFDPLRKPPVFTVDVALRNFPLVQLNDLLRQDPTNFDFEKGILSVYAEMNSEQNRIVGYAKPLVHDVSIFDLQSDKGLLGMLWQGLLGAGAELLENPQADQVALKLPINGSLDQPDTNNWVAATTALRNAFIEPLKPMFEGLKGP